MLRIPHDLNLMVMTPFIQPGDEELLFNSGNPFQDERVFKTGPGMLTMHRLLVLIGAFPSITQARKSWKKTGAEIPPGFSEFWIGKKRDKRLTIWNPTE